MIAPGAAGPTIGVEPENESVSGMTAVVTDVRQIRRPHSSSPQQPWKKSSNPGPRITSRTGTATSASLERRGRASETSGVLGQRPSDRQPGAHPISRSRSRRGGSAALPANKLRAVLLVLAAQMSTCLIGSIFAGRSGVLRGGPKWT
jgi:hypothetical protein